MGSVEASRGTALQYKVVGICASWDLFLGEYEDEKWPQVICFVQSTPCTRLLYCLIQTDMLLPSCGHCSAVPWRKAGRAWLFAALANIE